MGALHQVNTPYYGVGVSAALTSALGAPEINGHPDDKLGWAVGAGLKLNAPMIGTGDYFQSQVTYTQGAVRYVHVNENGNYYTQDGGSAQWGLITDAVFGGTLLAGNATDLELTTAWNVNAAYEHFWSPRWRTSLYGGYAEIKYNEQANAMLCRGQIAGAVLYRASVLALSRLHAMAAARIGASGGSAHAPSGTSPKTSTWASMCCTRG